MVKEEQDTTAEVPRKAGKCTKRNQPVAGASINALHTCVVGTEAVREQLLDRTVATPLHLNSGEGGEVHGPMRWIERAAPCLGLHLPLSRHTKQIRETSFDNVLQGTKESGQRAPRPASISSAQCLAMPAGYSNNSSPQNRTAAADFCARAHLLKTSPVAVHLHAREELDLPVHHSLLAKHLGCLGRVLRKEGSKGGEDDGLWRCIMLDINRCAAEE